MYREKALHFDNFPHSNAWATYVDLAVKLLNRSSRQGHPRVMIYINFVELLSLMLNAKFQKHRPSGSGGEDFLKVFAIYSHGGHLGHVTWIIYINFRSPFLWMLHMKFGFDCPSGFRGDQGSC